MQRPGWRSAMCFGAKAHHAPRAEGKETKSRTCNRPPPREAGPVGSKAALFPMRPRSGGLQPQKAPYGERGFGQPNATRALRNRRSQGPSSPQDSCCQEFCTARKARSG